MENNDKIYTEVAEELGISKELVKNVYNAYWAEVRATLSKSSKEDPISINIPSLGKFAYRSSLKHKKHE